MKITRIASYTPAQNIQSFGKKRKPAVYDESDLGWINKRIEEIIQEQYTALRIGDDSWYRSLQYEKDILTERRSNIWRYGKSYGYGKEWW